jgi:hypothetical protein
VVYFIIKIISWRLEQFPTSSASKNSGVTRLLGEPPSGERPSEIEAYIQSRSSLDFLYSSKASLMTSHKSLHRKLWSSVRSWGSLSGCKKNRTLRTDFFSLVSSRAPVDETNSDREIGFHPWKYSCEGTPKEGGKTPSMLQSSSSTGLRTCIDGGWRPH